MKIFHQKQKNEKFEESGKKYMIDKNTNRMKTSNIVGRTEWNPFAQQVLAASCQHVANTFSVNDFLQHFEMLAKTCCQHVANLGVNPPLTIIMTTFSLLKLLFHEYKSTEHLRKSPRAPDAVLSTRGLV